MLQFIKNYVYKSSSSLLTINGLKDIFQSDARSGRSALLNAIETSSKLNDLPGGYIVLGSDGDEIDSFIEV